MTQPGSTSVPKSARSAYDAVMALIEPFCADQLNEDYAHLCRELAAALARKRPSPLARGKPEIWACGIVYALGTVNFLFDQSQTPHIRADALCAAFGVKQSSASNKARFIRELFGMFPLNPGWCLPSLLDDNPMVWMLEINGIIVDVRDMPRDVQAAVFQKGLIPYIPADRGPRAGMALPPVEPASVGRYRQYRTAQVALNSKIVDRALSPAVFDTAVRDLGVSLSGRRLQIQSEDEISVIMDYALHEVGTPGARVIDQYRQRPGGKNPLERELLQAAAASAVGVYRVQSVDPRACQLTLRQLAPVQREVTVIDISFSQSPIHGAVFFTRLLELSEFNMTGGAALFFTAALEAQVMQAWSQTEPGGRYRQVFELHRRSGVPLNYASVAAGRQRGVG